MMKHKQRALLLLCASLLAIALILIYRPSDQQSHSGEDETYHPLARDSTASSYQGIPAHQGKKNDHIKIQISKDDKILVKEIDQILSVGDAALSIGNSYRLIELLNQLIEVNPELAIYYLNKNPRFLVFQANKKIIEKLYLQHPDKLKEFIRNIDKKNLLNQAFLSDSLSVILSNDGTPGNMQIVKEIIEENPDLTAGFLSYIGYGDIAAALALRKSLNLKGKQASEFDAALGLALLDSDPKKTRGYFGDLNTSNLTPTQSQLANVLARDHPEIFAEFAEQCSPAILSALLNNQSTMAELLKTENLTSFQKILEKLPITEANLKHHTNFCIALTMKDTEKGFMYVESLPEGPSKVKISSAVLSKYYSAEPTKALTKLAELKGHAQETAAREISKHIAQENPSKALESISNNPVLQKKDCYREVAKSLALSNPIYAIQMIEDDKLSETIGSDFRNEMINHTVQNWAKQDLKEAQQWVEKLPATDQPKGVQGLVATWMKADPIAASEWLSQQPVGPARDAGAQEIINQIKDTDPEMAEQWRKSMTPKE
jgi:hypothetical protein